MKIGVIRFLDKYIGGFLCVFFSLFLRKKKIEGRTILAIQLWGVGESILTLPALKELEHVTVLVTERNKDIYVGHAKTIIIDTTPLSIIGFIFSHYHEYDVVIDCEEYLNTSAIIAFFVAKSSIGYSHGIRSRLYTQTVPYDDKQYVAQTFMDLLKPLGVHQKVTHLVALNYSIEDKEKVDSFLRKHQLKKNDFLVGIAVGVAESAKSRMWPVERFAELADHLARQRKAKILFIGAPHEKELHDSVRSRMNNDSLNTCGFFSLPQLFYLVKCCSLIIGNDSGIMHIGEAMGTKTVGLFGPNLPVRFGPLHGTSIYKGHICEYSPCINVHKGEIPDCYYTGKEYQKCMKHISVDDVYSKI